jgi:LPXTG-motif cell wall-anchored protein
MVRRVVSIIAVPSLLLVALGFSPVAVLAGDPCYHGFEVPPRSEEVATQIKVAPCAFGPTVAHVPVGATVTFFNGPDFRHLITGANAEWGSRDVEVLPGQEVSFRFDRAGIYPYACALHRGMSGAIVVGDVAVPAAAASTTGDAAQPATGGSAVLPVAAVGGLILVLAGAGLFLARRRPVAV